MIRKVLNYLSQENNLVRIYTPTDGWIDYLFSRGSGDYQLHTVVFNVNDVETVVFNSDFPTIYLKGA